MNQITKILLMGKIVDKTETKIVTLDGVEIIKQVTKVLMPNGKYRYPTVYFTVNDDVKALTTEQLDKIRIPVYKQLNLKLIWKKVRLSLRLSNDRQDSADEWLIETLQYRFKSAKSHHSYIVRVERYQEHAYCVKFFDKANMNSKLNLVFVLTHLSKNHFLYIFHIMLDVLKR